LIGGNQQHADIRRSSTACRKLFDCITATPGSTLTQIDPVIPMPSHLRAPLVQRIDPQRFLIDLLTAELEDSFALLKAVELDLASYQCNLAWKNAQDSLQFIRYFARGIEDLIVRRAIYDRSEELEGVLAKTFLAGNG